MTRTITTLVTVGLFACASQTTTAPRPTQKSPGTIKSMAIETPEEPVAEIEPEPADLVFPDEEFRKKQPVGDKIRPFKTPGIDEFRLKNGVDVYLVESHNLPTVSAQLAFASGSLNDPKGKEGLTSVCMGLMSDGTEKLDKIVFSEALADIASSVSSYGGREESGVTMSTLTSNLDATLDLFADTLLHPGLRQDEFERAIKRSLVSLKEAKATPTSIARRVGSNIYFGPKHVFGRLTTEASYQALTLDECKKQIASYVKPAGAKLYIVGDINRANVLEKFGSRLKDWTGRPKRSALVGSAKPRKGRIFFVDAPGAEQSVISMGHPGPKRKARDYFATSLMSSILGGGFSSRINMNLREKNGYAYGARGSFSYTRTTGQFLAYASVRANVTKESVTEFFNEFNLFLKDGVKDEEIVREKAGTVLGLPARFATGRQVLGTFQNLVQFGLPLSYYDSYVQKVQAVTKKQIEKAAKRYLKPSQLAIVIVGDGATVLPALQQLDADILGNQKIIVLDADGNEIKPVDPAKGTE